MSTALETDTAVGIAVVEVESDVAVSIGWNNGVTECVTVFGIG